MSKIIEINQTFEYNGKTYKCIEHNSDDWQCEDCNGLKRIGLCNSKYCLEDQRMDGKNVIFKENRDEL